MTRFAKTLLIALLALAAAMPFAGGQARAAYSRAEIDQMLAPIALYPDPLLSQLLMAATFPMEVVEAARWSRAHPGIEGDAAVRMVEEYEWDPSVKSLVAFPQVLARMDENLEWTQRLGDAFVVQEPVVMEAIQDLRRRAQQAGQLASDDRVRVIEQPETIVIEPANPQYLYVPYYDPWIVYGSWWWPAYPPIYWAPWPGYVAYRPGYWWGAPIGLSVGFFFGGFNWYHRHAYVHRVDNYYVRPYASRYAGVTPGRWQQSYWRRDAARWNSAARSQVQASSPLRDPRREWRDDRRGVLQPRVDAAPRAETRQSFQGTPERRRDFERAQRPSEPRVDAAPRVETRQSFQGTPERRRDFERAQRPSEPRRFEQRQATPPAALAQPRQAAPPAALAAPRFERREQRIESREQRIEPHTQRFERRESRAERNEHPRGRHRFN